MLRGYTPRNWYNTYHANQTPNPSLQSDIQQDKRDRELCMYISDIGVHEFHMNYT